MVALDKAWSPSPGRRSNAGRVRVQHPGDYATFNSNQLRDGTLYELFQAYDADRKSVCIQFSDGHPTEHIAAVRMHQLDVAFVTGTAQHAGCEAAHLWSEQVFAVLPSNHYLADRSSLVWSVLIRQTFIVSEQTPGREIHDYLLKRLSELGRYPEVHRQNVGRDNLMSLVAIGRGLTLTSEATTSTSFHGLVYRPIEGETLPFSAVWSPMNDNPALRRLLSMARTRRSIGHPVHAPTLLQGSEPSRTPDPLP